MSKLKVVGKYAYNDKLSYDQKSEIFYSFVNPTLKNGVYEAYELDERFLNDKEFLGLLNYNFYKNDSIDPAIYTHIVKNFSKSERLFKNDYLAKHNSTKDSLQGLRYAVSLHNVSTLSNEKQDPKTEKLLNQSKMYLEGRMYSNFTQYYDEKKDYKSNLKRPKGMKNIFAKYVDNYNFDHNRDASMDPEGFAFTENFLMGSVSFIALLTTTLTMAVTGPSFWLVTIALAGTAGLFGIPAARLVRSAQDLIDIKKNGKKEIEKTNEIIQNKDMFADIMKNASSSTIKKFLLENRQVMDFLKESKLKVNDEFKKYVPTLEGLEDQIEELDESTKEILKPYMPKEKTETKEKLNQEVVHEIKKQAESIKEKDSGMEKTR